MEKARIGDLSLDYASPAAEGHHYPLLFIPGMHEESWLWANWMKVASQDGWDAWAINLRGHGNSRPKNLGKVSIMNYVEDVEVTLREIGPAILVGHSMGGLIAQIVADRNPKIPAVVLVNSAPPRGIFPGNRHTLARYWKPPYLLATTMHKPLNPQWGDMRYLMLNRMSPERAKQIFRDLVPESGRATQELAFWWLLGKATKIYCPVLVIGATDDRLTPVSIQKTTAQKYRATYREFPGAHVLPVEENWRAPIKFILQWAANHKL
ncbi:MAG: alpha/beta fold hydrolase [Candidatus Wildermuthbacteria bacterium]|nr:alpha/beta fold hydrolase [Candidatus Wildermuthbacteria bacterium]